MYLFIVIAIFGTALVIKTKLSHPITLLSHINVNMLIYSIHQQTSPISSLHERVVHRQYNMRDGEGRSIYSAAKMGHYKIYAFKSDCVLLMLGPH